MAKKTIGKTIEETKPAQLNFIGEKITYDVKLGKLYLGKAQFNNLPNEQLNGKVLNVMTLETKVTQFTDTEKIYSDTETFLPVRVERDILKVLLREKITEDYNQNKFAVTITKNIGSKSQETLVIEKDSPIHNAVLLPYSVRRIPDLEIGKIIVANLPLRKLELKLVSIEEIKVPAGTFKAYHFVSTPKRIEIWISADERRIPLKIQSSELFGYSLVMSEYAFDHKI
ncbi:MAG: DUF3108 domain-containing protein [Candidatus Omnitrophica bacterium]|nr:DUF3108 domain-containing protein [Candidatus Omnitrophota bacterium]